MGRELAGLPFERFPAVNGAASAPAGRLTRFEVACLMSHQAIWRRLVASGEPHAIVLEDDLHLMPGFAELARETAWVPSDAHAVKLDSYFQTVLLGPPRPVAGNRTLARLYSRHESSAAYLVTRAGAELYLRLTTPPRLPADYSIFPANPRRLGLMIYQLAPAAAVQDHLLPREKGGQIFTTAMGGGRAERTRPTPSERIAREAGRFVAQGAALAERAYVAAAFGARTARVAAE